MKKYSLSHKGLGYKNWLFFYFIIKPKVHNFVHHLKLEILTILTILINPNSCIPKYDSNFINS